MKATGIVLFLIAVCAVAISGCGRKYTATASLRVTAKQPTILSGSARAGSEKEFEAYLARLVGGLMSRSVLVAALGKPDVARIPMVRSETESGDAVKWLQGIVKVRLLRRADIITVSCTMDDPNEAAVLANAVVDAFLSYGMDLENERRQRKLDDLQQLIDRKSVELRRKQTTLSQLVSASSADGGLAGLKDRDSADVVLLRVEVKSLEKVLTELVADRERARIDAQAAPRVIIMERAQAPAVANRSF